MGAMLYAAHEVSDMLMCAFEFVQGCLWFVQFRANLMAAHSLGQEFVAVYSTGTFEEGLGRSQKAEVRWMEEHGFKIHQKWDINRFRNYLAVRKLAVSATVTSKLRAAGQRAQRRVSLDKLQAEETGISYEEARDTRRAKEATRRKAGHQLNQLSIPISVLSRPM